MEETAIKDELIEIIEHADLNQLKEIYRLLNDYFNNNESFDDWDLMPEPLKQKIDKSIEQANAGLGIPANEAIRQIREKHGLNG